MPPSEAAEILHDARWKAGLTQAQVAQRAGITQQTVAQYERARRQPSVATLTRLIAACGFQLGWSLIPAPGLADYPSLDLLSVAPIDRLPGDLAASLGCLAGVARGLELIVGGKAAARMHGAAIRVFENEIWVDDGVDLDQLTGYLARAGVNYVSPSGDISPAVASHEVLAGGWPLVAPHADLLIRPVEHFRLLADRATRLLADQATPSSETGLLLASAGDCPRFWADRDLDHLALQRALRLTEELALSAELKQSM